MHAVEHDLAAQALAQLKQDLLTWDAMYGLAAWVGCITCVRATLKMNDISRKGEWNAETCARYDAESSRQTSALICVILLNMASHH